MNNIHEQVRLQLEHLKSWVDGEKQHEEDCKRWGIPYTPSRTKWSAIDNYELYKAEVEKNGDKNLLVMVRMNGEDGINMYGVYPFARRYTYESYGDFYLVHRTKYGTEILAKESECNVVEGGRL